MAYELAGQKGVLVEERLKLLARGVLSLDARDHLGEVDAADLTLVRFPFGNWDETVTPRIMKNGTLLVEDTDYTTDYVQGEIELDTALVAGDDVRASYRFGMYSAADMGLLYDAALDDINGTRPRSTYTSIDNVPADWYDVLTVGAYKRLLQSLMMELNHWRARLIWPDPSGFVSMIQAELTMVNNDLMVMKKQIKRRASPRVITSGRWAYPRTVNQTNWNQYTVIR